MTLVKLKTGFAIVDLNTANPVGTVEVGQIWQDSSKQYNVEIKSFNDATEVFDCVARSNITGGTWNCVVGNALDFFNNYVLVFQPGAVASVNGHPNCKSSFSLSLPKAMDSINYDLKIERVRVSDGPTCECGGRKSGFKDYTRQHSSWCPVYKE